MIRARRQHLPTLVREIQKDVDELNASMESVHADMGRVHDQMGQAVKQTRKLGLRLSSLALAVENLGDRVTAHDNEIASIKMALKGATS